jgi:23S rRNA U2552 (ribose-2'-O)-methylase RlmE/FtsJ
VIPRKRKQRQRQRLNSRRVYTLMREDIPWENNKFVSIAAHLEQTPDFCFLQEGWKEIEHLSIITAKNRIASVDNADEWELRKKITNPYEAIFSGEDGTFPSLAKVQPLSRSYFKMIEMLEHADFWGDKPNILSDGPFISAHICEGPGGFIQATIERLIKKKISTKGVYAMTLKPTKSNIPGWRRSIHFLKKYPQVQLEYGADDTGDILKEANQKWFSERAKGAHLFTADGGFDFSVDYTNQEQMAFPLLLASFTIGLLTLKKGGTMIIKLFDIYGSATQDLFLGVGLLFDRFTIYKPATSRPCNSERYFIGVGYHGTDGSGSGSGKTTAMIKHLQAAQTKHAQSPLTRLFKNPWPSSITDLVNEQIRWQESLQISSITDTLNLQKNDIHKYILNNICLSKEWCEKFGVKYSV